MEGASRQHGGPLPTRLFIGKKSEMLDKEEFLRSFHTEAEDKIPDDDIVHTYSNMHGLSDNVLLLKL